MSAFDGAGPEYKAPTYRAVIILGVVAVTLIVLILTGPAWLLPLLETPGPTPRP